MKTHNTDAVHQIDVTRGRKNTNRAGSWGIDTADAGGTEVSPTIRLQFGDGFTVTDGDDGVAIVNASGGSAGDPALVGSGSVTIEATAGTSMVIAVPAGVEDGHVMVMAVWKDDDAGTPAVVATGWTQIGADNAFTYFVRVANAEPATYTVTYGAGARRAVGTIVAFKNIDPDSPVAAFDYGAYPDPPYVSDVELSLPTGDYYLLAGIETNRGDVDFTAPSGWTMLAEGDTGGSGTDHTAAALAGKAFTGSTAASPVTFGSDIGDLQANAQIALRQARALSGHIIDPTDAHAAAAISVEDSAGYFTGSTVETALTEVLLRHSGGLDTISAHGNAGATETIDPADGNVHTLTLDADCTITLTAPPSGLGSTIEVHATQDGTGGWDITWPGTVAFVGSSTPASTAAGSTAIYILQTLDGGASWIGAIVGGGMIVAALDDLTDVTITAAAAGESIRYTGSGWVNDAGVICVDSGTPTYDTGSPPGITMATNWGIVAGMPYYDDAGADAGEEAALFYDPLTDHYFLIAYDF